MMTTDVVLLSMPFGALDRAALGASLLAGRLHDAGFSCEVEYPCFDFAERIGVDDYLWVQSVLPYIAFAGDQCFAPSLYGNDWAATATPHYEREILVGEWNLCEQDLRRLRPIRGAAAPFLDALLVSKDWGREYRIVGFTSTFEQNLASLAFARLLHERWPELQIVFGGANWEGEMGVALHETFGFVDFACSGEAEDSFPRLVASILDDAPPGAGGPAIEGVIHRDDHVTRDGGPARRVEELDELPVPDYSTWQRRFDGQRLADHGIPPALLFETARGCWWGAKSHCTFCGLNGDGMAFRSKSADRAHAELTTLLQRHPTRSVSIVDNILDMRYFRDLLPRIAAEGPAVEFFWEIKANLSREQVQALAAAGVRRVQPGIESLSDGVLRRMRKGTTGLRNVQLLKWCAEAGIRVDWNILLGFPGESAVERAEELARLHAIRHLAPPGACAEIRIDRFSPNFDDADQLGFTALRPLPVYAHLYPTAGERLHRIAYSFAADYQPGQEPDQQATESVRQYVARWIREGCEGSVRIHETGTELLVVDDREPGRIVESRLRGWRAAVLRELDTIRTIDQLVDAVPGADRTRIERFVDALIRNQLAVGDGRHCLSVALRAERTGLDRGRSLLRRKVALGLASR